MRGRYKITDYAGYGHAGIVTEYLQNSFRLASSTWPTQSLLPPQGLASRQAFVAPNVSRVDISALMKLERSVSIPAPSGINDIIAAY